MRHHRITRLVEIAQLASRWSLALRKCFGSVTSCLQRQTFQTLALEAILI